VALGGAVDQEGVSSDAGGDRQLVHDAGGYARRDLLGPLTEAGELER
jgi:hypothetical protein